MGTIKMRKTYLGTIYERYGEEGQLIHRAGALGFVKEHKGQTFFIIHNLNGELIEEANNYLNNELISKDYKKRELAFSALKLFYSFTDVFSINGYKEKLNKIDVNKLILFIEGGYFKGITNDIDLETKRANTTVNMYLNVIRDYFKTVFGIEDGPLFAKTIVNKSSGEGFLGHTKKRSIEKFRVNKVIRTPKMTPKYIKPNEYKKIINLIKEDNAYSIRDLIIIRLMFECGMRIGEVLGLTFEDIEYISEGDFRVLIRNRVSDKPYQRAKGVMKPKSRDQYKSKEYKTYNSGFQVVIIEEDLKDLVDEYIDETRDAFLLNKSIKKYENLHQLAVADQVDNNSVMNDENQYIFLSHQHFRPLTQTGWNQTVKKIFKELGISVDKETKRDNLNHRFRHGFAMEKVKQGYTLVELADALRHQDLSTCRVYYNPDEKELVELLKKNKKYMENRNG